MPSALARRGVGPAPSWHATHSEPVATVRIMTCYLHSSGLSVRSAVFLDGRLTRPASRTGSLDRAPARCNRVALRTSGAWLQVPFLKPPHRQKFSMHPACRYRCPEGNSKAAVRASRVASDHGPHRRRVPGSLWRSMAFKKGPIRCDATFGPSDTVAVWLDGPSPTHALDTRRAAAGHGDLRTPSGREPEPLSHRCRWLRVPGPTCRTD